VTLFSQTELKAKPRAVRHDRRRRRVPTGAPRIVESSSDRVVRLDAEAWAALVEMIRRSAEVRLDLLRSRDDNELVDCPWSVVVTCDDGCRCGGLGKVLVAFLRNHYARLPSQIEHIASSDRRPS
jgi:hypothetical protein